MGINDDDDDDETDKIPTHHLEFCLLGFCPLGLILHTIMIMVMILMMMMMIRGMILVVMTIMIMIDKDGNADPMSLPPQPLQYDYTNNYTNAPQPLS